MREARENGRGRAPQASTLAALAVSVALIASGAPAWAQPPAEARATEAHQEPAEPPLPSFIADAYRPRQTDSAAVERGKALYQEFACNFCHGADARGAAGGPSLLRSALVQRDQAGELIGQVIRNGVPGSAMAAFPLNGDQVRDVAEFLHSFALTSRDPARQRPETIVTGNAGAGRRFFAARCSGCHSVEQDLAGIASRIANPRTLQQQWLMPRNAPPIVARVATAQGAFAGELVRIDEFAVAIKLEDGRERTFAREGDVPLVTLEDPLAAHKELLPVYTDRNIHDVTAYLVTIK